jgi:hypothetical protein
MRTFQHQWALCVINATNSHLMLMQSMDLEVDNDDIFIVLYNHHHSILRAVDFLSTIDSLFMSINIDDIIPRIPPPTKTGH